MNADLICVHPRKSAAKYCLHCLAYVLLVELRIEPLQRPRLSGGHALISTLKIRDREVVERLRRVRLYSRGFAVGFDRFAQTPRVVIRVAELVVNLGIIRLELQRLQVSADRFL